LAEVLPAERRSELIGQAVTALRTRTEDEAWEEAIRRMVHATARRVAASEQHLRRYVPLNTAALSISLVQAAVPLALAQMEEALQNRANLERLYLALREAAERFLAQQQGWKGGVARMIITDRTVGQATQWIVTTGFGKLADLLREPGTQARLALALDDALARVLDRPISDLASGLAEERITRVSEDAASRIIAMLRDPALAPRLTQTLDAAVARMADRPLGELVGVRTAERAEQMADAASARVFAALCREPAIRRRPGIIIWEAVRADLAGIVVRAGALAAVLAALLFAAYNLG
nr:hypothetical protein [Gemmatimonadota bacterium]